MITKLVDTAGRHYSLNPLQFYGPGNLRTSRARRNDVHRGILKNLVEGLGAERDFPLIRFLEPSQKKGWAGAPAFSHISLPEVPPFFHYH